MFKKNLTLKINLSFKRCIALSVKTEYSRKANKVSDLFIKFEGVKWLLEVRHSMAYRKHTKE
jgi:hypothetical protein